MKYVVPFVPDNPRPLTALLPRLKLVNSAKNLYSWCKETLHFFLSV